MLQDGKYKIVSDELVNIKTDVPVLSGMPVFVFLAKDKHTIEVLTHYLGLCANDDLKNTVEDRIEEFDKWQKENSEKVREPD